MSFTTEASVILPASVAERIQGDLRDLCHHLRAHSCHEQAKDVRRRMQQLDRHADADDHLAGIGDLIPDMDAVALADLAEQLDLLAVICRLNREVIDRDTARVRDQIRGDLEGVAS